MQNNSKTNTVLLIILVILVGLVAYIMWDKAVVPTGQTQTTQNSTGVDYQPGKTFPTMGEVLARPEFQNLKYAEGGGESSELGIERYVSSQGVSSLILRHVKAEGERGNERNEQPVFDILKIDPSSYCNANNSCDVQVIYQCFYKQASVGQHAIAAYSISSKKVYDAWVVDLSLLKFKQIPDLENVSCTTDEGVS